MNLESTDDCALSAPRGEAASHVKRQLIHNSLTNLGLITSLALSSDKPEFVRDLRIELRNLARLFDIPVTGED